MRMISKELQKSYYTLIMLFVVGVGFFIYSTWRYTKNTAKRDIDIVKNFLENELQEPEHQDIDIFFYEALKESPKINDLYINIFSGGKSYIEEGTPVLPELKYPGRIEKYGFHDYYVLESVVKKTDGSEINIRIIRGLKKEKEFMEKIITEVLIGIFIIIVMSIIISKFFYNKIIPQIDTLVNITDGINLETFEINIDKSKFYYEFSVILSSYENMLRRLETQASGQLEFVHSASHELKTPISIMKGYLGLIKRWGLEKEDISKEAMEAIYDEVRNMEVLIEKLLFLAKEGRIDLIYEKIDLSELINDITREMEILYPEQEIIFKGQKVHIFSDYGLLKQLFRNLIDNARKYGLGKPINLTCYYESNVVVEIWDKGMGISKEELGSIFEKFYRADKSRNREQGGHGLGLSIVKSILNLLKGDIAIDSRIDEGTHIKISLPKSVEMPEKNQ